MTYSEVAKRLRLPLGFLLGITYLLFARPTPLTLGVGGVIALIGVVIRAWASGYLRKNDGLATAGPYSYTRNPLYLGSLIMGLGFTIAANRLVLGLVFATLFIGIYVPVMRVESATLAELFGDNYRRYAQAVPAFFPRLSPYRDENPMQTKFDASLYRRYREYQAAIGFVVAWTLLALKAFYFR